MRTLSNKLIVGNNNLLCLVLTCYRLRYKYKSNNKQHSCNAYMDPAKTIAGLCRQTGLTLDEVNLFCYYCSRLLTPQDKRSYERKRLRLKWVDKYCFGACIACTCLCAQSAVKELYQQRVSPTGVENLTGNPLGDIYMRCRVCLTLLSPTDKLNHLTSGEEFVQAGNQWWGTCRGCCAN
uniref:Protein E6 n=1 Tax=Eidolon bat papillomavirus TaxID=3141875 RepID=A0AAU7E2E9_9PAPI